MIQDVLRLLLTLLSLAMAYCAQLLLDGELPTDWVSRWPRPVQFNIAYGLYAAAMVIFGLIALPPVRAAASRVAALARPKPRRDEPDARIVRPLQWPKSKGEERPRGVRPLPIARLLLVLAAVGLGVAASIIFCRRGESAAVRWLWLGSLASLFVSQIPLLPPRWKPAPGYRWLGETLLVLLVVAAAFLVRFYLLETIPHDFHGDMASHGLEARKLLAGQQPYIFNTMWAEIPTMAFMPAALSLSVFGNNLFGLRMTSVIGGTLAVLGLYLLTRELLDGQAGRRAGRQSAQRVALLAAAFLAVSYVHNHFSRIAEYMDPWPFALFSLYLLVRGLKRRERLSLVASGLLLAICLQMYYSARVVPVIVGLFLVYALLFRRDLLRGNWGGLVLFGLALLLGLGPMIPFYVRHSFNFVNRSRSVFLFHPPVIEHLMGKYQVDTVGAVVKEQLKRSLLLFHHSIDSSTQFGLAKPMLDPYTSPLLVLGMGVALRRLRREAHTLAVFWLLLLLLFGSMLTNNAPFWPRLVGILPPAALLVALAVERIWALIEKMWGETASALVALLLTVGVIYVGLHNWQLYYSAVEDSARPRARIGRYLYGLDPKVSGCLISEPFHLGVREIAFLAYPRVTVDLPQDAHGATLDDCPGPHRVFILTPNHLDVLPELQARYPGGVTQEHHEANGTLVFASYLLDG